MIRFVREGITVYANVNTGVHVDRPTLAFKWNCANEAEAEILRSHLQGRMEKRMQIIREEAYHTGYNHGKKHAKREKYFMCGM